MLSAYIVDCDLLKIMDLHIYINLFFGIFLVYSPTQFH
jgi:hypothetical protein